MHIIDADASRFQVVSPTSKAERDARWSPTGRYVVFESNRESLTDVYRSSIYMMHLANGSVRRLTTDAVGYRSPIPAPDGSAVGYAVFESPSAIYALSIDSAGVQRELARAGARRVIYDHRWTPDGKRLTFMSSGPAGDRADIHIGSFDPPATQPFIATPAWEGRARWSADGRVLFLQGDVRRPGLFVADADGSAQRRLPTPDGRIDALEWCPDGKHAVFSLFDSGNQDVYAFRFRDNSVIRLTAHPDNDAAPDCGPDRHVVFTSNRSGTNQLYTVRIPGS